MSSAPIVVRERRRRRSSWLTAVLAASLGGASVTRRLPTRCARARYRAMSPATSSSDPMCLARFRRQTSGATVQLKPGARLVIDGRQYPSVIGGNVVAQSCTSALLARCGHRAWQRCHPALYGEQWIHRPRHRDRRQFPVHGQYWGPAPPISARSRGNVQVINNHSSAASNISQIIDWRIPAVPAKHSCADACVWAGSSRRSFAGSVCGEPGLRAVRARCRSAARSQPIPHSGWPAIR